MNSELVNRLLKIASVALAIAGLIFAILFFFTENDSNKLFVIYSLICTGLSNLFNVVRTGFNKSDK